MPKVKDTGVTPKQLNFINEYFRNNFNGTQAAIKIGSSKKSAGEIAYRMLKNVDVKQYILKQFTREGDITQLALRETVKLATSDIANYCEIEPGGGLKQKAFEDIPEGLTSCIKEIKVKRIITDNADGTKSHVTDNIEYKLHDKCKAIDNILKMAQLLTDKLDITSKGEKIQDVNVIIKGSKSNLLDIIDKNETKK